MAAWTRDPGVCGWSWREDLPNPFAVGVNARRGREVGGRLGWGGPRFREVQAYLSFR